MNLLEKLYGLVWTAGPHIKSNRNKADESEKQEEVGRLLFLL